jgi:CheY-like chemotaxis protein
LRLFQDDPEAFDLVITDQTMPGMTGLALSKEILEIQSGIPIVLCTGHNDSIDEKKAQAAGVREFLLKPLTRQELAEAVRRALDSRRRVET